VGPARLAACQPDDEIDMSARESSVSWTDDLIRLEGLLSRSTDWLQARRVLHRTLADLHALEAAAIERRLGGRDG
jgi:hypothetical protein